MKNRILVVSDTHFGHRNILKFEAGLRPFATIEEHDDELVRRWNFVVGHGDTVWHLGDVYFGGRHAHGVLGRLNGIKRLVMGNHDVYPIDIYRRYFDRICAGAVVKGCLLTHVPVHTSQLERRYTTNIHGHMHSKSLDDPRYICVSVEHTNLAPVVIDELLAQRK